MPAAGLLDLAFGGLDRASEGAFLMTEQLAFEQSLGDRGAVDRHERLVLAVAGVVQAAGEQFLAGAAGAEQHDAHIGAGDALDHARHFQHFRRGRDHPAEHLVVRRRGFSEAAVLHFQRVDVEGTSDDVAQRFDVDGLLVEVPGAVSDRPRARSRGRHGPRRR